MEGFRRYREQMDVKQETPEEKKQIKKVMDETAAEMRYDTAFLLRSKYADFLENSPLNKQQILYEAFGGRGMICNPYALFQYLLSQGKFQSYTHVWVIDDFEDNREQIERYKNQSNVKFVKYQSQEYVEALATSGYLINNVSFPGYFTKRKGQVYLNTWHGIPMKTMGFDIPGGNVTAGNSARNLLSADYLISAGPYMTKKAYLESYKMEGIYQGTILEGGFPRNDVFFHTDRAQVLQKLQSCGVKLNPDKKIILYAPTWKGERYSNPDVGLHSYFELLHCLEERIDTEKYQILVKPHQIVYYHMKEKHQISDQFVPATMDANELLSVVDVLISDYSSIYFDFLVSGRPVLFFLPDRNDFDSYRGLYFGPEKLPGPIASTCEELAELIIKLEHYQVEYGSVYQEQRQWANPYDDGNVCKRTVKAVFGILGGRNAVKCNRTDKKRLLFYGGDFLTGHITSSFVELLHHMDYSKYDVTVLAQSANDRAAENRIDQLPREVRVLYWKPFYVATLEEMARHKITFTEKESRVVPPRDFYRRELLRAVGKCKFDYAFSVSEDKTFFSVMFSYFAKTRSMLWNRDMVSTGRISREKERTDVIEIGGQLRYITNAQGVGTSMAELETIPLPDPDGVNFVSMGSMRNGKNYEALIKVFGFLYQKNAKLHLYLIGEGTEKKRLMNVVAEQKLEDAVTFLGQMRYPLGFIRRCSCFVLYAGMEGKSLSSLEARTMKIPVAFGKPGMEDYCDGKIPPETFDADNYNSEVYQEFEKLLKG